jgi:hypothetical protein
MRGLGISSSSREMLSLHCLLLCWFMGHEGFRGGRFCFLWGNV